MAKTNTIITIGREYGSAGRQIGYKVAEDLIRQRNAGTRSKRKWYL